MAWDEKNQRKREQRRIARQQRKSGTALVVYKPQKEGKTKAETNKATTIKEALGPKGSPMSPKEAAAGANEKFYEYTQRGTENYEKYHSNCQRCVWATELRQRGYDVEAMPRTKDNAYARIDEDDPKSFINVGTTPVELTRVGNPFYGVKAGDLNRSIVNSYPDGARGMVILIRGNGGHVLNFKIENGKAKYYDGQNGKPTSATKLITEQKALFFYHGRMDDKEISPRVTDFVKQREK